MGCCPVKNGIEAMNDVPLARRCLTIQAQPVAGRMLEKRFGRERMRQHAALNERVRERSADYDARASSGQAAPIYQFDHGVLHGEDLEWDASRLRVPGYAQAIDLEMQSPYADMH